MSPIEVAKAIPLGIALVSWLKWIWQGFAYRGGFDPPKMPLLWTIVALQVFQL